MERRDGPVSMPATPSAGAAATAGAHWMEAFSQQQCESREAARDGAAERNHTAEFVHLWQLAQRPAPQGGAWGTALFRTQKVVGMSGGEALVRLYSPDGGAVLAPLAAGSEEPLRCERACSEACAADTEGASAMEQQLLSMMSEPGGQPAPSRPGGARAACDNPCSQPDDPRVAGARAAVLSCGRCGKESACRPGAEGFASSNESRALADIIALGGANDAPWTWHSQLSQDRLVHR